MENLKEKVKGILTEKGYDFASDWFGDNELTFFDDIIEATAKALSQDNDIESACYNNKCKCQDPTNFNRLACSMCLIM